MIITALLLQIAEPVAPPCRAIAGGVAEGMCLARVAPVTALGLVPLLPAEGAGPAIPFRQAKIVARLLRAYDKGDGKLPPKMLGEGAMAIFCAEWGPGCLDRFPLDSWPLPADYQHGAPYLLSDGRIRIEWVKDGALRYISLIAFDGEKIASLETVPASIPVGPPAKGK